MTPHPSSPPSSRRDKITSRLRQPRAYAWLAAGLLFVLGQFLLLNQAVLSGLLLTGAALIFSLAGLIKESQWQPGWHRVQQLLQNLNARLQQRSQWRLAARPTPAPDFPLTAQPRTQEQALPLTPRIQVPAKEIYFSKYIFLGVGLLLVLGAQPLLLVEKFIPALLMIIPGSVLIVHALLTKTDRIYLGRLDVLLKGILLGLPGAGLIGIGNVILINTVHIHFVKELIGHLFNAAGIFMLLALLPQVMKDPEPEAGNFLDYFSGAAKTRRQFLGKAALVLLGFTLIYFSRQLFLQRAMHSAFILCLAGIGSLTFSFPWTWQKTEQTAPPSALLSLLVNVVRLGAFGLALYLAYLGQKQFSQEQFWPALYYFGAAWLALLVSFREPAPGLPDLRKEAPLAWYWEVLGLLVVLAVGTWLRLYLLDKMPYGIECDEAGGGIHALDVLEGRFNSLVAHPIGRPLFMLMPQVITIKLFGAGNLGMRLGSMFFGVLGIFVIYLMSRHFYGPRIGLATAALLALARLHVHFSRYGFTNVFFIVLLMLGFYFLVKGLSSRRKWHFVLAGVAFSLTVQTETAARLLPIICLILMVYLAISQRHFFRRNWQPLLALFLGVWLAGAGVYLYFAKNTHILMRRVQEVSIYSGDPNAPQDATKGFIDSAKMSLTQLNWHGDYRSRHNGGLSGEAVLDFWTAIFFGLGFLYSLYYWKRWRYGILLIWFFGFMSASIFSIEAPQSHRAFGFFPAAFLIISGFLDRSRRLLRDTLGRPGAWAGGLVFLLLLVPVARVNYHKYFDTFPAFDTNCTAIARYLGGTWPQAEHFIMTAYFWMGHPPFQLYAGNISGHFYFTPSEVLPMHLDTKADAVYSLVLEYPPLLPTIQYFYPRGIYRDEVHPKFGEQFVSWAVLHTEIMKTRGLQAKYWTNPDWSGAPSVVRKDNNLPIYFDDQTWPLKGGAGSAAWEGTIFIPHDGHYTFYAYGADYIEVSVGKKIRLTADGKQESQQTLRLAGGLHRFRVKARHLSPGGHMLVAWSCPEEVTYFIPGPYRQAFIKQPVPNTHLFTYPEPVGLLSIYYSTADWTGAPRKMDVEPALLFAWMSNPWGFSNPLSAEWKGWIKIKQAGNYLFNLQQSGYGEVEIDHQTVFRQGTPPVGWTPGVPRNPLSLLPGKYPVVVRWVAQSGPYLKFFWTPPNGKASLVPPSVLIPAEE